MAFTGPVEFTHRLAVNFRTSLTPTTDLSERCSVRNSRRRLIARSSSSCYRPRAAGITCISSDDTEPAVVSQGRNGLLPHSENSDRVCGFAALLGPSNSGKSTLLNRLVGMKVAIVTPKVQTTRCRVAGIVTEGSVMTIYVDTPGVFRGNGRLDRAMVRNAWSSATSADVIAIIADAAQMFHRRKSAQRVGEELHISEALKEILSRVPRVPLQFCICLNKIDTIPADEKDYFLKQFAQILSDMELQDKCVLFPMSALNGDGVDEFTSWIRDNLPPGPWLYPEDDITDMPMRSIAAEVTREKAFMLLKHELPYEVAVNTTSYKEQRDGSIRITQDLIVKRDSQKRIVTGKGGSMIKAIGMKARYDLQEMTATTVHLMLTVKVRENWKNEASSYLPWGLEYNS